MVLNITTCKMAGVVVVYLCGAIPFGEESASLLTHVKELLSESRQIVLELGNVTQFDSGSVGILVAVYDAARKVGAEIKLANLNDHTREVLQITKLLTVFEIFRSAEDAIESFHGRQQTA
jgi:anti-sigma B factor antagonist